uniref:Uncharacterized protein n=1 Tax=Meloidogyne enterolobii TaxID=390850 RepID=A0A6V7VQL4_MELEN|nr:unnamed protein product [Meloidogyne enterolobii]
MKLSSFLFLYLLLVLLLFDTTESSSNQTYHRFQPRDVETSGTGTSEHERTGSIPTTSVGHNQGVNSGQENAENLSQFGHGSHPFLQDFGQQQYHGFMSNEIEIMDKTGRKEKYEEYINQLPISSKIYKVINEGNDFYIYCNTCNMKINKENDEIWNVNNTLKAHNLSKHGGYATKEHRKTLVKWLNELGQQNNFDIEEKTNILVCKICGKKVKF